MKRIVCLWAFVFGLVPLAWSQTGGVAAELELVHDQLLPGEDMALKVRIENRSGQDITVGKEDDWVTFTVSGGKNMPVPAMTNVPVAGEFALRNGESGARTFNLTPYFDISKPGHYDISAVVKISQWNMEIKCKAISLNVVNGIRLANLPDMEVGVRFPGDPTNAPPSVRRYILEKTESATEMKLYLRLTDSSASQTYRVVFIDRLLSFGEPQYRLDRYNNIHVLNQDAAHSFGYFVLNPMGQMLERQTYDYTQTRPNLRAEADGTVDVAGGVRKVSPSDLPPGMTYDAATPRAQSR